VPEIKEDALLQGGHLLKSLKIRRAGRRPIWAPQVLDKLLIQLHCCTARGLAEPGALIAAQREVGFGAAA
jgi:hypothetical protein